MFSVTRSALTKVSTSSFECSWVATRLIVVNKLVVVEVSALPTTMAGRMLRLLVCLCC